MGPAPVLGVSKDEVEIIDVTPSSPLPPAPSAANLSHVSQTFSRTLADFPPSTAARLDQST